MLYPKEKIKNAFPTKNRKGIFFSNKLGVRYWTLTAVKSLELPSKSFIQLQEYKDFLIYEERKSSKMRDYMSIYMLDRIGTNFPLESSLEQLYLIPGDNRRLPTILNFNLSNSEMKNLLYEYYQSEVSTHKHSTIRLFIYLFRYSLLVLKNEPKLITDFTFEVFKKQYRFYQKAEVVNSSTSMKLSSMLIRFYVFLCKTIREQNIPHDIFAGTLYNDTILGNNTFSVYYKKGYKIIKYNPFEEVPLENRWLLLPADNYANMRKTMPYGIDFLEVKDISYREDLKHYIWKQSSMSVSTVTHGIYINIEFLNFIYAYKQANDLYNGNFIDADLLEQWNYYISSKVTNTRNDYIKRTKGYLKFYKDKYQIPQLLIDSLTQKRQDFDGGHPLTKKDVDLFSRKFQDQRSKGIIGELCYIIFNLSVTTKLRSGEILAMERDCVIEKSGQTGVIQYFSKVTGNQRVKMTLPIEKINLIEKAILLTSEAHSKANEDTAKFIFIKEDYWKKDRIIKLVYQFVNTFTKIQKDLEGELDGKYRPYNLRSTFIDNIYTEGIKDGLPTAVLAEMAGNGVHTARKYYRKTTEVQAYVEMFAGVRISGVDVYGEILEETEIKDLNPVEQGLGGCRQEGCVHDEEQYECLICPYFATTVNRTPLFKEKIARLRKHKESTLNSRERSEIDAQLKLYTAYYTKLLEKNGDEKNSNV